MLSTLYLIFYGPTDFGDKSPMSLIPGGLSSDLDLYWK